MKDRRNTNRLTIDFPSYRQAVSMNCFFIVTRLTCKNTVSFDDKQATATADDSASSN